MNRFRKVAMAVTAIIALAMVASAGAIVGAQVAEGNIESFIVDISHSVPVEISAPVELDSGETITVTAPITVNVELRVSVDGQGQAKIIEESAQEPEVAVTEATQGEQEVDELGIPYSIESNFPELAVTEWTAFANQHGDFAVSGEIFLEENAPAFSDILTVVRFYDHNGNLMNVQEIHQIDSGLEPGGYNRFDMFIYTEPNLIGSYVVNFKVVE